MVGHSNFLLGYARNHTNWVSYPPKKLAKLSDWICTQSSLSKNNCLRFFIWIYRFDIHRMDLGDLPLVSGCHMESLGHIIHGSSTLKSPRIKRWTSQNPYHHHPPPHTKNTTKPTNMAPNHDDLTRFPPRLHPGVNGLSTWTTTQWLPVVSTETAPRIR